MSMESIALRRRAVLALASSLALPRRADGRAKAAEPPPSAAPVPELAGVYHGQLDPALPIPTRPLVEAQMERTLRAA